MKLLESTFLTALVGSIGMVFAGNALADPKPDTELSDVKEESAEAVEALGAYAAEQRDALEARAEAAASELATEVDEARRALSEIPATVETEARETLEASITRAEAIQQKAVAQLEEAKTATRDQWETTQTRLAAAIDELAEARREVGAALRGADSEASSS